MGHLQHKFDRASSTYDARSQVQKRLARLLASRLPAGVSPGSILELACGTGNLTAELRHFFPSAAYLATDASAGMLERTQEKLGTDPGFRCEVLDVLRDLPGHHAELVASAALVQWLPDLTAHFRDVADLLPEGGIYALSAFCRTNFPELNAILEAPPFSYRTFPGHLLTDAAASAREAGFELLDADQETWPVTYPSVRDFFAMLKATGAVRSPELPPSRARILFLFRELARTAACPGGISITWKPWTLILRKSSLSKGGFSH